MQVFNAVPHFISFDRKKTRQRTKSSKKPITTVRKPGKNCTIIPFKHKSQSIITDNMMIVGQVSGKKEAKEISFIAKLSAVGKRARDLAHQNKE